MYKYGKVLLIDREKLLGHLRRMDAHAHCQVGHLNCQHGGEILRQTECSKRLCPVCVCVYPTNTIYFANAWLMLGQRRRR